MTVWGGRFEGDPADALWQLTVDPSDRRLLADDVTGSLAHVAMLGEVGLLDGEETARLTDGLRVVLAEAEQGRFEFTDTDEDVHTAVERRLGELIGPIAGKLHTGRSRNDQVALDLRLYLRRGCSARIRELVRLVEVLVDAAARVGDTVVPSYTHLQQAQAVPLAHHLLAYAWMVLRDVDRFDALETRLDVMPLGAGASGGSSLPLDPEAVAERLGFSAVFANSLDAVAARDVVSEYAFCCAQTMVDLSRLAEELVLWTTAEFGWVTYDDAFTTGSSALPQKKNPDVAELVRGKAATVIADASGLLVLQKGLPLAYNRDLQEDKRAVFHADDTVALSLEALIGMISTASFHPPAPTSWVTALDLAEALVGRGVPFREAHAVVGTIVARLVADGRTLAELTEDELLMADARFRPEDLDRTSPEGSVERRTTPGGGSHESVAHQLDALRELLERRATSAAD